MRNLIHALKALSDEHRLRALLALKGRELCACQLVELLELAPSTVSKHMGVLTRIGLVKARKQGRWIYYRLPEPSTDSEATKTLKWALNLARQTEKAKTDRIRLQSILRIDPDTISRKILGSNEKSKKLKAPAAPLFLP